VCPKINSFRVANWTLGTVKLFISRKNWSFLKSNIFACHTKLIGEINVSRRREILNGSNDQNFIKILMEKR
jgi:hypothetical protein